MNHLRLIVDEQQHLLPATTAEIDQHALTVLRRLPESFEVFVRFGEEFVYQTIEVVAVFDQGAMA